MAARELIEAARRGDEQALVNQNGGNVYGSGLPSTIMRRVISAGLAG